MAKIPEILVKYEYTIIHRQMKPSDISTAQWLDILGAVGWELCAVSDARQEFYFKRVKLEEIKDE